MGKKAFWPKLTTLGLILSVLLMSVTYSLGQESLQPNTSAKEKSPNTAFWWSLLGTVVPVAAVAAGAAGAGDLGSAGMVGLLFGPSLGYFYGGLVWRGLLGVGVRAIGVGVMFMAFLGEWFNAWGGDNGGANGEDWGAVALVGAGIMLGSAIWDVAAVKGAVNRRNIRLQEKTFALSPFLNPRTKSVGLSIRLSF
jgi:hypothetical protein